MGVVVAIRCSLDTLALLGALGGAIGAAVVAEALGLICVETPLGWEWMSAAEYEFSKSEVTAPVSMVDIGDSDREFGLEFSAAFHAMIA